MNLVFSHRLMQRRKHYFEDGTKLKKPSLIKPLLKRAMKQEMKMTTNMQLRRALATWTSAIWDGTAMVKRPISCPLTGLMYQCVLKASCLTFTVYLKVGKCNLSLRNIHKWRPTIFDDFRPPYLPCPTIFNLLHPILGGSFWTPYLP